MKAEILKIAGVKSEKEFYKKYPSEEAFMKVHGKAFKKAQTGMEINKAQLGTSLLPDSNQNGIPDYLENPMGDSRFGQTANYADTRSYQSQPASLQQMGPTQNFSAQSFSSLYTPNAQQFAQNAFQPTDSFAMPNYGQQFINKANQTTSGMRGIPQALPNDVGYTPPEADGAAGGIGSYMGAATDIIGGIQGLSKQKEEKNKARQARKVTDIQALASGTREEEQERRYNTPWDNLVQANQMFPTYGVGTNVITRNGGSIQRAEYGRQISGNPTEIQNTYAPNNIYDDGGYEPLDDSNVKQYYHGGYIRNAQDGMDFSSFMGEQGGAQGITSIGNMFSNNSAESQIGKGIGTAAGTAFGGPVGGMIGGAIGNIAGGMLNTSQKAIKRDQNAINRNIGTIVGNATGQGLQAQYSSYVKNGGDIPSYEEGGYMNPEYNPQVITMFGDHTAEDFADYAHKYRAGGHLKSYTPPSERAMETYRDGGGVKSYGLGGELQTHWGGGAETISHNPYLPGTGETVMFRGKSHEEYSPNGETGIGVTYGGNPVEVERGEPMVELEEGGVIDPQTGEVQKSGVVFGNLKIPNQYIDMLGDKNAKGKKFKNYVNDLSKIESKQNKLVEKSTNELNALDPKNSFDKLKLSALQASIQGANMKLKSIADKKINAASLQNAINDTAEENGLVADDLARGKVKIDKEAIKQYAKYGGSFPKAQDGDELWKGKNIKNQFKLSNGVVRYVYEGNVIVDRDDKGKILTSKKADANDIIDYKYDDNDNHYTKTFGNNTKKSYYSNGRVAELDAKGRLIRKGNYDNTTDKITKWEPTSQQKYDAAKALKQTPQKNIGQIAEENERAVVTSQPEPEYKPIAPVRTVQQTTTVAPRTSRRNAATSPAVTSPVANVSTVNPPLKELPKTEEYVSKYGITPWQGNTSAGNKYGKATASSFSAKQWDDVADKLGFKGKGNKEFQEFLLNNPESAPLIKARHKMLYNQDPMLDEKIGFGWAANELLLPKAAEIPKDTTPADAIKETEDTEEGTASNRNNWMNILNAALPYFRPTDQEGLDPNQLSGEMYALSSNQLEPVPAQGYQPDLGSPYDISFQDQLNANQSDYRAAQRMVGYNPAAQANLNAQKYQANQGVLGEQFRANQAMKDKVYGENRNILNDAKLKNLAIYDQQYGRQAQALSNTKATTQAALSSISDKYAKNKLENRELGIYENMYNYRFDKDGRAVNMNPLAQFNMEGRGTSSRESAPEGYEYETVLKKKKKEDVARNGSIVKSYKNI
jgi:hypothetical protein